MRSTRLLWRVAGIAGLLATLLFVFGFGYAVKDILFPSAAGEFDGAQTPDRQDNMLSQDKINILALGDSLTKGTGDQTGEGYVGKVKKGLEAAYKKPVFIWNYAVNGQLSEQLLMQLNAADSQLPGFVKQANVIMLTIGGNDLNRAANIAGGSAPASPAPGAPAVSPGTAVTPAPTAQATPKPPSASGTAALPESLNLDFDSLRKQLPAAADKLAAILAKLAELNPKARIVYVGLYHPYLDSDPDRIGSPVIQEWNAKAFASANRYANVTVVPTYDLFEREQTRYLSVDHFHPNALGYERMAERVLQVLE
ncbi:GDSL-type esterase/lipase family protein [Paenibacillus sp. MBLB4367]|uniref:GDSL-type esterase/lipase family protein n=1 Tax=Paenibacillus sp. MBLB4367 TaxID=3384767 RepID=UPI003907EF8D